MTAWWYWALFALLTLAVVIAFWFFHWSLKTNTTRELRQTQRALDRDMFDLDYYAWKAVRDLEAWAATMEQAVREHPERVAALLSEDVAFGDVIDAVAS